MEWKKEKSYGLIGTIVFHVLLVLLFLVMAFHTPLPLPGEEGVEVNLGFSNQGMGIKPEKKTARTSPKPQAQPASPKPQRQAEEVKEEHEKLITQNTEETPALPAKEKEKAKELTPTKVEDKKPSPDTTQIVKDVEVTKQIAEVVPEVVEKPVEKPKVNPRALYRGPATENNDGGGNEGKTGKPGNQGKANGVLDAQKYEGVGGLGNGIVFDLGGRGAKNIPKPSYNSPEQGRVVVTIYVDKQGNVKSAIAGAKGTNVSDPNLRKMAEEAAKKAKFSVDSNAPESQKGTITYNFIRKNS